MARRACKALMVNTSLARLGLVGNSIDTEGASSLLESLTGCNTTLVHLGLDNHDNISETVCTAIAAFTLANEADIRLLHAGAELDLSSKSIDAVQAKRVATELAANATVTTLLLNQMILAMKGAWISPAP
jgi:3-deoxy-D-manno-octulosonic-acid transferase